MTDQGKKSRTMLAITLIVLGMSGSRSTLRAQSEVPAIGTSVPRTGDEIMVCGQLVHTTAPVVLWTDPGGYDAYRVERRFGPWTKADWKSIQTALDTPNRYGIRDERLTPEDRERVRGGGWDLPALQKCVDQFVLHYDVCGTSRKCFEVLHDMRCLSVHFLLDIDGTIYQTLDLKERAWHATSSNGRSVGVEIAQIGAYPEEARDVLRAWYQPDDTGTMRIHLPAVMGDGGVRTPHFVGRPARPDVVTGTIQGVQLWQYDFTPEQYASLVKLTATLCRLFPQIRCDYPRDAQGQLVPHKLPNEVLRDYQGLLGHYHIQSNKTDPGPALQWDSIVAGASKLLEG